MATYLSCEAREGQFPGECAIKGTTYAGGGFSLFAPQELVELVSAPVTQEPVAAWLRVDVLDSDSHRALVRLPGQTFENGRTVTVSRERIEEREARQFA